MKPIYLCMIVIHLGFMRQAGGFDKLLLDSLYEDDAGRRQIQLQNAGYNNSYGYGMAPPNPFDQQQDPFIMSNGIAPPTNVQMAMMAQQQHHQMVLQNQQQVQPLQYRQNMLTMTPYQNPPQYSQQQNPYMGPLNPFGDPFNYPHSSMPQEGNHMLL